MSTPATNIPPGSPEPPSPPPTPPLSTPPVNALDARYPVDDPRVPAYLRGKTLAEAAESFTRLEAALASPPAAPPPQTYQPQPQSVAAQAGGPLSPPDPQLSYDNPQEYQRQLLAYSDARTQAALMQGAGPLFNNQASLARATSQRDPEYAAVWSKFGPEIDAEIAGVPAWQRSVELYNKAAAVVRGSHFRDFAAEEAQRLVSAGGLERGGGPANTPPSAPADPIDALFADTDSPVTQKLLAARVTPSEVRENYIRKMHLTPQQAADYLRGSRTLSSADPLSTVNNPR